MSATCKSCKFFFDGDTCRRFPPQRDGLSSMFASVGESDWCGEYKRQQKEEKKKTTPKADMDMVISTYIGRFSQRFGKQPPVLTKDRANVKRLINSIGVEATVKVVDDFFSSPPVWAKEHSTWSLSAVLSAASATRSIAKAAENKDTESVMSFLQKQAQENQNDEMFKDHFWFLYVDYVKKTGSLKTFTEYLEETRR